MKKFKLILITLFSLLLIPRMVYATSGKITVSGGNQVVVGNKVTITVKLSAGASWEMDLNYDKSYLQLVSSSGEAGGTSMVNTTTGNASRTYTFSFKALKKGSTTVKVGSYYVVDDNFSTVDISTSGKTINIITKEELEASYSKDNNLKSLSIEGYEISPAFNKDTTEYSVTAPEGTKTIKVSATANDSKSSVSGTGEKEVTEGINNIEVVVKAENGSEKKYKITVNVIDESPIEVTFNDNKYNVVKLRSNYQCKELFEEKTVTINEVEIPACYNKASNTILVGLKDQEGNINGYVYDNGKYSEYKEVVGTSIRIIILEYDNDLTGYKKEEVTIDGNKYNVFKYNDNSTSYVVYGINLETGDKDFYLYDSKNNTFTLYDKEFVDDLINKNNLYLYIMIAFGSCIFLLLICLIFVNSKKNKIKKKIASLSKKDTSDNINYTSEVEDDNEIYNLLDSKEEDKKRKKRK